MLTSEALKEHSMREVFSTWSSSSHWAILIIHQQLLSSTRSHILMFSTIIFVWIWLGKMKEGRRVKAGPQLTVSRVFWLSFKVSYLRKIWAKIKRQLKCKPREQWKKLTHSSAVIVNMVENSHAGQASRLRSQIKNSSKFMKKRML